MSVGPVLFSAKIRQNSEMDEQNVGKAHESFGNLGKDTSGKILEKMDAGLFYFSVSRSL